nr:hypothetical protein [Tanacetum cinerariifolium]
MEESKSSSWFSKGQKLEIVRVMWSTHYYIYFYTDDFASREKISTYKVHSGTNTQQLKVVSAVQIAKTVSIKVSTIVYKSQRTHKWYQSHLENFAYEDAFSLHKNLFSVSTESLSPQVVSAAKLPILNPNEFDLWKMRTHVNVSPSSSAQLKMHDDKTKREAKGKSPVEPLIGYRNFSAEFKDFSDNNINEDNVAEADFNNLETSITVTPIPTTRVHKDHHVTQIIGDPTSATQTRSMTRVAKDQGGISQINNDDFHTCMFACFLSQEEPKRVHQALKDPKLLVLNGFFRNKKDERGIVVRKKARLVAQGYTQNKGIDYEEVFPLVARIEAIRLFLAYASFMGFMVYQMDVKSAFIYGTIEEEVYVCQPPGFEDPDYPTKVYKVINALYGLHQAPRAWQKGDIPLVQIYVDDIIFGSTNKDLRKDFEKLIKDKFEMSSMGELTFFLGLQVKQKKDVIFIT